MMHFHFSKQFLFLCVGIVFFAVGGYAQDTRSQESRKAKLEKEIALIDKQLRENASRSSDAMAALTLVQEKVAARKELVAESD